MLASKPKVAILSRNFKDKFSMIVPINVLNVVVNLSTNLR